MENKRLIWVDVTKGFLMVLVVLGHFPGDFWLSKYIYWFHMPAFFLLSGIFFKEVKENEDPQMPVKKRFLQLMVPYLFFLITITTIRYGMQIVQGNHDLSWYIQDVWTLIVAGRFVRGAYGVFWFVTTLFFTYLLFMWMTKYLNRTKQIILLVAFYLIAHLESFFAQRVIDGSTVEAAQSIPILWNLDVTLMAIVYFSLGYYGKSLWMNVTKPWLIGASALMVGAFFSDRAGMINYQLSMKFLRYDHLVLDFIIPIASIIVLVGLFQRITKVVSLNWLVTVEKHSIAIMYLHIFTDMIFNDFFEYGVVGYTLLGIFIPMMVSVALQKSIPYGKFLLGDIRAKKPKKLTNVYTS